MRGRKTSASSSSLTRRSLPDLHVEIRLELLLQVANAQLDVFRIGGLLELDGRAALVVAVVRALAGESRDELVLAGLQVAEVQPILLSGLNARRRETVPASELVVGVQCGGSDAFSGVTARNSSATSTRSGSSRNFSSTA